MRWTDPSDGRPRRHARAWLDPSTWRESVVGPFDPAQSVALADWIERGRAVVVRRRDPGSDAIGLGVALPSTGDKRRIAFAVRPSSVVRVEAPLALHEVVDDAPVAWRAALHDLLARSTPLRTPFGVVGSLSWQAVSGEPYVTARSDVDLLWTADSVEQVDRVIAELLDWEARHGLRADGELLLSNGDGIAWRELTTTRDRVLVKHRDRVSLKSFAALWTAHRARLEAEAIAG